MVFEVLYASYLFPINQRNQNLFTINTYRYWHKIKKEMQNIDELPPGPVINCYLPGLEKGVNSKITKKEELSSNISFKESVDY